MKGFTTDNPTGPYENEPASIERDDTPVRRSFK